MQYRDKKGRFASFPVPFMEKFVKPNAKRHGLTVKEYIAQNKPELVKFLKSKKTELKTNKIGLERLIAKLDNKTKLFIYNGNKKYSCNKLQLKQYLAEITQLFHALQINNINYTYVQLNGFETVIFVLPDKRILQRKVDAL